MFQQLRVPSPSAPRRQKPDHRLLPQLRRFRHHRPYPIASPRGCSSSSSSSSSSRRHAPAISAVRCGGGDATPPSGREGPVLPAPASAGAAPAPPPVPLPQPGGGAAPRPGYRWKRAAFPSEAAPPALYFPSFASPRGVMAAPRSGRQPQNDGYRTLSLSGHVGFGSLPDQLVKKSIKQGFCFNILCIGETGSGKSTLINSLFNTNFDDPVSTHFLPSVQLRTQTYELQESNVLLKLTIVNTVGFGDQINKEDSYQPIVDYIDAQFEAYLQEELKIKRSLFSYHDTRIHVCLYFISPTGHSLKTLDLLTMKSLDSKVNIIPIIGKADSISKTELQKFKNKIMSELVSNGVQIYQFPTDDETVSEINTIMNGHLPFAVVGSTEEVKIGNKMVRARQYPWGTVQVENENHCDFVKLRKMLICTNMEDLREQTHARHYESYRRCRLEEMGFRDIGPENKLVRLPCSKSYADRKTVCHSYASVER
ncbi:septin-10 isoform X3 [Buteo buteo]|uniref:septin-10 isoform X3 n=1 Tax=Buteo buteo TaxID=30397 RepID=UPI003EB7D267